MSPVSRIVALAGLLGALVPQLGFGQLDAARLAERLALCANCHEPGPAQRASVDGQMTPLLHGQQPAYLVKALGDYAARRRDHFFMRGIAAGLTEAEVQAVVAHYSRASGLPVERVGTSRDRVRTATAPMPDAARRCIACHGDGITRPAAVSTPVLAGQHALYLQRAFNSYAQGQRHDGVMSSQARDASGAATLDASSLEVVALWFSQLSGGLSAPEQPSSETRLRTGP